LFVSPIDVYAGEATWVKDLQCLGEGTWVKDLQCSLVPYRRTAEGP
jgi:hypothetical protein